MKNLVTPSSFTILSIALFLPLTASADPQPGQFQLLTPAALIIQRGYTKKFVTAPMTAGLNYYTDGASNTYIDVELDELVPNGKRKPRDIYSGFLFPAALSSQSMFYSISGNDMQRKQRFDLQMTLGDESTSGASYHQTQSTCTDYYEDTSYLCEHDGDCNSSYCVTTYYECDLYQNYERSMMLQFTGRTRPYTSGKPLAVFNGTALRVDLYQVIPNITCEQVPELN